MSVAKNYARALLDLTQDRSALVQQQLLAVSQGVDADPVVRQALMGPSLSYAEKSGILEALVKNVGADVALRSFLLLLCQKGRLQFLQEIAEEYETARVSASGGLIGRVASAEPLSTADLNDLEQAFSKRMNQRVSLRTEVDSTLLAGLSVTVNGVTYDGTLRSKLDRLRQEIIKKATELGVTPSA